MAKENLIAACGLYCGACEMHRAARDKDEAKIDRLLEAFNAVGYKVRREDIESAAGQSLIASIFSPSYSAVTAMELEHFL